MSGSQLEMGDLGENANEAYLASRATVANLRPEENLAFRTTVANLRPEENLASRATVTNLRPDGNVPSRVKTRFRTKVIRGLSTGKQILDILSNVSEVKSLFAMGTVPCRFSYSCSAQLPFINFRLLPQPQAHHRATPYFCFRKIRF